jgi:predicted transcriptional regulator
MDDKYILVSLNEKKSKDLAHTISNQTARKILDHLSTKEQASAVEMSKSLKIAISTVTYNIKHLQKQGLIEKKGYSWSEKGKKIFHYAIAQKMIIIVPKNFDWKESLKKILPVALIGIFSSAMLKLFYRVPGSSYVSESPILAEAALEESAELAFDESVAESSRQLVSHTPGEYAWIIVLLVTIGIIALIVIKEVWRKRK